MPSTAEYQSDFEWIPDYDELLEQVASTDVVDFEWSKLRDIIKHKIDRNIAYFLSELGVRPDSPRPFTPVSFPSGGLKLAPFPPRRHTQTGMTTTAPINYMTEEQANDLKGHIFTQLHAFETNPPFTVQRLCELVVNPTDHYNCVGKYLRAVEKSILVTSTWDAFPVVADQSTEISLRSSIAVSGAAISSAPQTPLFSPIPFLHDDARRSKSRSPPPSPLALASAGPINDAHPDALETKALGLVDELDDPSPGHLSDHPTALSSVTTISAGSNTKPPVTSLEERFVKAETLDGDLTAKDTDKMDVDQKDVK
ncbi:hypothetical protein HGRIS_013199 [Hohenbuehelia grisea]|uniref:PPP4R2-domain-containing protein n=1 Tax=Hohenbuehelia grisea TaxID=104357 RepID=A0ABR3IUW1_9AGAR